jgi:hypothetical protein
MCDRDRDGAPPRRHWRVRIGRRRVESREIEQTVYLFIPFL